MSRLAIALAILAGTHGAVAAPDRAPFKVTYDAEHLERMRIVRAQFVYAVRAECPRLGRRLVTAIAISSLS